MNTLKLSKPISFVRGQEPVSAVELSPVSIQRGIVETRRPGDEEGEEIVSKKNVFKISWQADTGGGPLGQLRFNEELPKELGDQIAAFVEAKSRAKIEE